MGNYYRYRITIGSAVYDDSYIGADLCVSYSGSASGLSFGDAVTTSISGSIFTGGYSFNKNEPVILSRYGSGENGQILGVWFIQASTSAGSVAHFSASDILALGECEYDQPPKDVKNDDGTITTYDRTLSKTCQLIEDGLESLLSCPGVPVLVETPGWFALDMPTTSGLTMRAALGYMAGTDGKCCLAGWTGNALPYTIPTGTDIIHYQLSSIQLNTYVAAHQTLNLSRDNYSDLTVGSGASNLQQITIKIDNTAIPVLQRDEDYSDYNIVRVPGGDYAPEASIELTNPILITCTASGNRQNPASAPVFNRIGTNIGSEFNCSTLKTNYIIPYMSRIVFEGYNRTMYAMSASFRFGKEGIYASVSSGTRTAAYGVRGKLTDILESKITIDKPLRNCSLGYDGLTFYRKGNADA